MRETSCKWVSSPNGAGEGEDHGVTVPPLAPELFNILINPTSNSFALRWHRDDVKETATEDEELEALGIWHHGVRALPDFLHAFSY